MAYFFEHFAHDALLESFPAPKDPPNTPKDLVVLNTVAAEDRKPEHYLRWLLALIGDVHQPLHMLRQHGYGKEKTVEYRGQNFTLLDFWEEYLGSRLPPLPQQEVLEKQLEKGMKRYDMKTPVEHFRNWARDAGTSVCAQVYGKLDAREDFFKIDDKIYQDWLKLAGDFTRTAGLRVAETLLEILKHKKHKAAQDHHGQAKYHTNSLRHKSGIMTNIMIAIVLVPMLLVALRWHERHVGSLQFFAGAIHQKK